MTIKLNRRQILLGLGLTTFGGCAHNSSRNTKPLDAQVIILGAGLAGLNAARILSAEGMDVLVLEANKRIGGRLYSLDSGDGRFSEAGGEQVGAGYARIRHTAKDLGIEIPDYPPTPSGTLINYKGNNLLADDWVSQKDNPFPDQYKSIVPASLLGRLAFSANPLKNVYSWSNSNLEDVSAYEWLTAKGLNEEALKLADHTLNANDLV